MLSGPILILIAGAIPAITSLPVQSPVSASITVEGFSTASPTVNIVDNPLHGTSGRAAAHFGGYGDARDELHLDFRQAGVGTLHTGPYLIISRQQRIQVGRKTDAVAFIENFKNQPLTLGFSPNTRNIPKGMKFELWGATGRTSATVGTAKLAATAVGQGTNSAANVSNTNNVVIPAMSGNTAGIANIFFVVETDGNVSSGAATNMELKISATGN